VKQSAVVYIHYDYNDNDQSECFMLALKHWLSEQPFGIEFKNIELEEVEE
jgi:hypothetical protein